MKEEDIDTLEGTLLDKAKDDPEFVEQILTHLIHVRIIYFIFHLTIESNGIFRFVNGTSN